METLEILNRIWYFCLFPIVALVVKEDREVPLLFFFLLVWDYIIFDVIGIPSKIWFLVQALSNLTFLISCKFISHKQLRQAGILLCAYTIVVNIYEHLSTHQTIFYAWWEVINWVVLDLLAACLILNSKIISAQAKENVQYN